MASQTITVDSNHDDLTGRLLGENITINDGAKLTIDSDPQETAMGQLGDLQINSGEIHIDGRYVREIAYSSGTGSLPAITTAVTWGSGGSAGSGKIIRYDSGTNATGILTLTRQSGADPNGTITGGGWSATVDSSKVGYLKLLVETQVWDTLNADSILRVTGDWYELGVGDGTDNQSFTLPHAGTQAAVWVETGNGTGVFEIWHRVLNTNTGSLIFFDSLSQWGATYESGFVFGCTPLQSTLVFGTSVNGGAPPNGARIRIPNVHLGTSTNATPLVETFTATSTTGAIGARYVDNNTNVNVYIDHCNFSSGYFSAQGTNEIVVSDSCFPWTVAASTSYTLNALVSPASFTNCAFINGTALAGDTPGRYFYIVDCVGGVSFTDCVFMGAANGVASGTALSIVTSNDIFFYGRNKFVHNQQDENTCYAIHLSTATNVRFEGTTICLNAGMNISSVSGLYVEEFVWGELASRGSTEDSMKPINIAGLTSGVRFMSGRLCSGGAAIRNMNSTMLTIDNGTDMVFRNFGSPSNKIDCGGRGGYITLTGVAKNIKFQRICLTNLNSTKIPSSLASVSDVTLDNCSDDYNDELELMGTRLTIRGVHGGSGGLNTTTGVEADMTNVVGTCFYDQFTSDTEGYVGLVFNDRGNRHLNDVWKTAGCVFDGLGGLLFRAQGDEVIYTWPWEIRGHTGFRNQAIEIIGVTPEYLTVYYDLDTGAGFSGSWTEANTLPAIALPASGFRIKIRILRTSALGGISVKVTGLRFPTTTTIADQMDNLYPLDTITLSLTGVVVGSDVVILPAGGESPLLSVDATGVPTVTYTYETPQAVDIAVYKAGYVPLVIRNYALASSDTSLPIAQVLDRNFAA